MLQEMQSTEGDREILKERKCHSTTLANRASCDINTMVDTKVDMQNTIEEVECLTQELKSESTNEKLKSPQVTREQTKLNSHGVEELSTELNTQNGDGNLLRTNIKEESLSTQNTIEESSKELNSHNVIEDPLRTLMKLNWEDCNATTIVERLQEVQKYMNEKEMKTEPLKLNLLNAVDEPLRKLMKLDWKHCDENKVSEVLKQIQSFLKDKGIKEEPPQLNTQSTDKVPSSVQKHPVSDLRKDSIEKEVELCSDKRDNNTPVQTNKVVRSEKIENEQEKDNSKLLTARLRIIRKQTQKSSVCEINGRESVSVVQCNKIVISEEIENQEKKESAVPRTTCLKSNVEKTVEGSVCGKKVREPNPIVCNNVVISEDIENQERKEDVILLSTPLQIIGEKTPSSICSKPLGRDFRKHVPILTGENDFFCDICLVCFNNKESLTKHMQVHSKDDKDDDSDVQVDTVVISNQGKSEGEVHLPPKMMKTVSGVIVHECPVCFKNFRRKYDLRRHLLTHSGTNFQCVLCSTCYKNREELSEHIRSHSLDVDVQNPEIHTDNVIRSDKNEVEASSLPKPIKTDSESITFECPSCKRNIRRKYDFRRHLFRHSGSDFQCVLCQAYCESKEDLSEHLRDHSLDNLIKKTNIQSVDISDKCESEKVETMLEFKAIKTNIAAEFHKHKESPIEQMLKFQKGNQDSNPNVQPDIVVMSDKPKNEILQSILQPKDIKTKTEVQKCDQKRNIKEYLHTQAAEYDGSNPVALCNNIIYDRKKTEREGIILQPIPMKINSGTPTYENMNKRKRPENILVSNIVHSYKVARSDKHEIGNIETVPSKEISLNSEENIHKNKGNVSEHKQKPPEANLANNPDAQPDKVFKLDKHKENQPHNPRSVQLEKTVSDYMYEKTSMSQLNTNGIKKTEQKTKNFMKKSKSRRNLSVQPNSMMECDVCLTRFKHKSSLDLHKRKHDTDNPYRCKICKKRFSEDRQLVIHFRTHSRVRAFQCDFCKKRFSQYSYLRVHMRVHSEEKPYVCETCGHSFAVRENLVMHMRIHTKEKPYQCKICGKSFAVGADLNRHSQIHLDEKPFKCDMCEKGFEQKTDLERHIHTHLQQKPFECRYCGTSFAHKVNLKTHMQIHTTEHPFKFDSYSEDFAHHDDLERHEEYHSGLRPFTCSICDKSFVLKSHFLCHTCTDNTGEKPYKCDSCGQGFTQEASLNKHKEKMHFTK